MDTEVVKPNEGMMDLEVASLQKRISELESQLEEAKKLIQKHLLEANEVDMLKMKSADTLTKAKSVIFENTKMIKNQELQIEALNQQVESLRDVVKITKELLEIRNLEVDQLESKIHCMEERHKAEKERQDLMHQRLEQMIRHNGDLKREYETQLCLFKALRDRYDERELAKGVVNSLKSDIKVEKDKRDDQNKQTNQNDQKHKNDAKPEKEQELPESVAAEKENEEPKKESSNQEINQNEIVINKDEDKRDISEILQSDVSKVPDSIENKPVKTENTEENQQGQNDIIFDESKNISSEIQPHVEASVVKE